MYVTPEQIQAAGKANVEALLAVANAQFAAFEKLATINATAETIMRGREKRSSGVGRSMRSPARRLSSRHLS